MLVTGSFSSPLLLPVLGLHSRLYLSSRNRNRIPIANYHVLWRYMFAALSRWNTTLNYYKYLLLFMLLFLLVLKYYFVSFSSIFFLYTCMWI